MAANGTIIAQDPESSDHRACSISGRTLDDHGKPLARVIVAAVTRTPTGGSIAGKDVSNDQGSYRIANLRPGEYFVRALGGTRPLSAPPDCESCCSPATDLRTTFYPRAPDFAQAKPLSLRGQANLTDIDIQLTSVPVYCARGEVRDAAGALVPSVAITLEIWDAGINTPARSSGAFNQGGRFLLRNLPSGSYKLRVTDGKPFGSVLTTVTINIEARSENQIRVTLPAWADLPPSPKAVESTEKKVAARPTVTAPPAPKPKPLPATSPPAPGTPPAGRYLQVVSTSRPQAEAISNSIQKRGLKSIIAPAPTKPGYFRVLVGPLRDDAEMSKTRADLEAAGFKNPIIQKY